MKTIDLQQAKVDLSRLIDRAADGESFVIAKAGKPVVKVIPMGAIPAETQRRIGFLAGRISVPDDFDRMGQDEIERLFEGE